MVKRIDKKNTELKIQMLTVTAAVMVLATGFKIVYTNDKLEALTLENEQLKDEFQQVLDEELALSHQYINDDKNYIVNDEIEVGGRTIIFVKEPTPTPTPTPTPIPEEEHEYSRYINVDSDEFIMAEDGVYYEREEVLSLDCIDVNEMIAFYSKVFQLDDQKVGDKVYELIELDEAAWENNNTLNGTTYETKEQAIARTIADISNFPENYDLSDIEVEEYELGSYKPEELIYKFSDVIGVNPYIALAVAYNESGTRLDSYNFQTRYNVGGLRRRTGDPHPTTSWGLVIYKNPAEGLYRFVTTLHDYFYVDEDSGYNKIVNMSKTYCENPSQWEESTGSLYINIDNYGYSYYYDKFSWDRDLIYPTSNEEKTI